MNDLESLKERLKKYAYWEIIMTNHAQSQAISRSITLNEIKENIINPVRLAVAIKQEAEGIGEEKYNCYFAYSKTQCQRYVLVINKKCLVCTVIKINRRWQHGAEKCINK